MDRVISKEFKQMMAHRATNIPPLALEELAPFKEDKLHQNYGYIQGVEDPMYKSLDTTLCRIIYRQKVSKPQYTSEGTLRKDSNGNVVSDYVPVPRECVLVKSDIDIMTSLPEGVSYEDMEDFMFIQSRKEKTSKGTIAVSYYYIIPRKFVYEVDMLALVLSRTRRKNYYESHQIALQDGTYVYISVVPLPKNTDNLLVLGIQPSLDFKGYIDYFYAYLQSKGYTHNLELGLLSNGLNLTYLTLEPTLQDENYKPLGSLIKQHSDELD